MLSSLAIFCPSSKGWGNQPNSQDLKIPQGGGISMSKTEKAEETICIVARQSQILKLTFFFFFFLGGAFASVSFAIMETLMRTSALI